MVKSHSSSEPRYHYILAYFSTKLAVSGGDLNSDERVVVLATKLARTAFLAIDPV
jgi:hypothetical protein